jgi:methyl-accepting chemotaxis protein
MNDLSNTVKSNAENTQQATKVVESATQLAQKGGGVVKSAITAMQEINESSNRIAEIIGVIDEIAFQTNLLALNASVEAARAGEQGRGFSVVATEVRNLAQRSATAAQQSSELIQNSVQKVRSGTAFVNETGAALMEIVDSIIKVGDIVGQITASSDKQSTGISQVNQAVAQMDDITQQNAALAEEAAASSMAMSEQSAKMTQLLNFFKVSDKSSLPRSPISAPTKSVTKMKSSALPASTASRGSDDWEEF